MADSKLLQGMLIGACIFLAFAIVLTWADMSRYPEPSELGRLPAKPTVGTTRQPQPEEAAPAAEAPAPETATPEAPPAQ